MEEKILNRQLPSCFSENNSNEFVITSSLEFLAPKTAKCVFGTLHNLVSPRQAAHTGIFEFGTSV